MIAAGHAFAEHFNGTPVFIQSFGRVYFEGIAFTKTNTDPKWTLPHRQYRTQRPRKTIKGDAIERINLKSLCDLYDMRLAECFADAPMGIHREGILNTIGASENTKVFGGYELFVHDGCFYISIDEEKLNDKMTEILGSEYGEAHRASK